MWPLLASTCILMLSPCNVVTVVVSALPILLVMVTALMSLPPPVKNNGAPFLVVNCLVSFVGMATFSLLTRCMPLVVTTPRFLCVAMFCLGMVVKLLITCVMTLCDLYLVTTVLVSGRLSECLNVVVSPSSVPLSTVGELLVCAVIMTLAMVGPLWAMAFAPLSIMAFMSCRPLSVLVSPNRTFTLVFPLALITTVMGAVRFSVYG